MDNAFSWVTCCWLAVLVTIAPAAPADKAAQFVIDISSLTDAPLCITVRTKSRVWQLPKSQVRKGFGLAWYEVKQATSNESHARMYIEVEPMEGRTLREACTNTVESLADTMGPFSTELVGDVTIGDRKTYKFGSIAVLGHKLTYSVDITTATPRTVSPAVAIVFEHKGALITVTVESFNPTRDSLSAFLKSVSVEPLPKRPKPQRLKILDATEYTHRYMTVLLPTGFVAQHAECPNDLEACFVLPAADKQKVQARITVQRTPVPRARGVNTFKKVMEWIRSDYEGAHQDVTPLVHAKIGNTSCYRFRYTRKEEGESYVMTASFKLHDQIWTWAYDTDLVAPKELKKHVAAWEKMLKGGNLWVAQGRPSK